ncbi:hypothetical protein [Mycobacterium sp.]
MYDSAHRRLPPETAPSTVRITQCGELAAAGIASGQRSQIPVFP